MSAASRPEIDRTEWITRFVVALAGDLIARDIPPGDAVDDARARAAAHYPNRTAQSPEADAHAIYARLTFPADGTLPPAH